MNGVKKKNKITEIYSQCRKTRNKIITFGQSEHRQVTQRANQNSRQQKDDDVKRGKIVPSAGKHATAVERREKARKIYNHVGR